MIPNRQTLRGEVKGVPQQRGPPKAAIIPPLKYVWMQRVLEWVLVAIRQLEHFVTTVAENARTRHERHDFHPIVFYCIMLERSLKIMQFPSCEGKWRKRLALHTATVVWAQLRACWDKPVGHQRKRFIDIVLAAAQASPANAQKLSARRGVALHLRQLRHHCGLACDGEHR